VPQPTLGEAIAADPEGIKIPAAVHRLSPKLSLWKLTQRRKCQDCGSRNVSPTPYDGAEGLRALISAAVIVARWLYAGCSGAVATGGSRHICDVGCLSLLTGNRDRGGAVTSLLSPHCGHRRTS
jgi:hypothetical protein